MQRVKLLTLMQTLLVLTVAGFAQTAQKEEPKIRETLAQFQDALQRHDLRAIEALVAPDIVVFENGHRNNGWPDFRDHHLLPEFKGSTNPYRTEIVRLEASPTLAWAYTRMNRAYVRKADDKPDVWAIFVLRKNDSSWKVVMLDWSVRRVE